jgi:hypothetical protein
MIIDLSRGAGRTMAFPSSAVGPAMAPSGREERVMFESVADESIAGAGPANEIGRVTR